MAVVCCENGHYYDNEKFKSCPHCQNGDFNDDDMHTMPLGKDFGVHEVVGKYVTGGQPQHYHADYDDDKTIAFFDTAKGNDFVTGWLVCVSGPERGRDFKLHNGFNRIGRNSSLDIHVVEDSYISKDPHCAVVYEYKKNCFYVVPQKGNITYLNGDMLSEAKTLETGDIIEIGQSEFEFIAFCRGERKWDQPSGQ